jgi:hypothetical protein
MVIFQAIGGVFAADFDPSQADLQRGNQPISIRL